MLESYFAARRFRSPFLKSTEAVSPLSVLWAFLLGPVYYWRKRAPIEALLFAIALGILLFVNDDGSVQGIADGIDLGSAIWFAFAVAAPVALPACYRRKGWTEVAPGSRRVVTEELAGLSDR